jgi:hypothetical protein
MRLFRGYTIGIISVLFSVFFIVLITSCTNPAKPTEVPPDPTALLNKAAQEVRNSKSVRIKLQLSGAPSFVDPPLKPGDPGNNIAFVSADGSYVAPDRVQAKVVAKIFGIAGEVEVIAIGDDQWMRNKILTADRWVAQIFSPGFNAAKLISSSEGIEAALKALKNIKLVGVESIDGVPMYHITGSAAGMDIAALTVGLIRGSDVVADIYIVVDTGRVDRVKLVQPDTVTEKEPKPTTWELEIFDYNAADIKIDAPNIPAAATQQADQATSAATAPPSATAEATKAP